MRVDQLIFLCRHFLLLSAIGLDNVHNLSQSCSLSNILDISIDNLVLKMRHLEIVLFQNPLQIRRARNSHLCAGLLLPYIDNRHLACHDLCHSLVWILRIRLIHNRTDSQCLNIVLAYIIVVRHSLGSPNSHHENISCNLMARTQFRHIHILELLKIFLRKIDAVDINPRTLEPLILPQTIVMISLRLRSKHDNLELLDALAN